VQERDPLSFGTDAGHFIYELNAGSSASLQRRIEIVNRKADVVDTRSALRQKSRDRRRRVVCLEQFHQRLASTETDDVRPIGVFESDLPQPQYIPKKRETRRQRLNCYSDVGYARAARG
jgi:hypothetical protein